jgi:hypothetical protein
MNGAGALDVALDERDAVHRLLEVRVRQMFGQRGCRQEEAHAESLAAAVVLTDQREAEAIGRARDVLLANHGDRRR